MWRTAGQLVARAALLFALLLLGERAEAQKAADPFSALDGRWVWVGDKDKLGLQKACADKWTELRFSADRKELTYRYPTDGNREETGTYNVLYQENDSIAMYLNGESRRLKSGDRLIWIAIIESQDRFLWRIHSQATDPAELAKFARVRCSSP